MVRKLFLLLSVFLITAFPLIGGEKKTQTQSGWQLVDETVAVVNGEPILLSDIKLYMLLFGEKDFNKALNRLINIYLVAQYGESRGIQIPPQKVQQIVQHFAQSQGKTVAQLYEELQRVGLGGAIFSNFVKKYNLYVATIQLFVLRPLYQNKAELETLIAAHSPKAIPVYTLEVLKIPKDVAVKNQDLLVSENFQKISQKLGIQPIEFSATLKDLKPEIAKVVKRLSAGQTDFAEDKNNIYLVKVLKVEYKTPKGSREKILKRIEEEKIEEFIKTLRENSVVKILPEALKALQTSP